MKRFLLYLASGLLAAIVGYLINRVPNLPDDWKPWVPGAIAGLIVVSAIVLIRQDSGNRRTADIGEKPSALPQSSIVDSLYYLDAICTRYAQWWADGRTLTAIIAEKQADFSFAQSIHTEEINPIDQKPQMIPFPLFEGIQKYIESEQHVLLVGSPGVGKSTALLRCLVDFAKHERLKSEPRIPVLVSLKKYQSVQPTPEDPSGMLALIRDALELEMPELSGQISVSQINKLLFTDKRLILLWDGLNEMPATTARTELIAFREKCIRCKIPLICSSRESGEGLGIKRQLVIEPLALKEVDRFLQECMPNQKQKVLQLLDKDQRALSRTPFVLWMLYDTFQNTGTVANTLGEAFQRFFKSYRRFKEDAPVGEARRKAWNNWMQHLAFTMLSSPDPTDPGLIISKRDAKEILTAEFGAVDESASRIEELLKYHLLEEVSDQQISFHHQLIQEYYASEALRERLPGLDSGALQQEYLNYLKWTESIALMLGFPEITETQALDVVRSGLEVDLFLGARLAGEVKGEFQEKAIELLQKQLEDIHETAHISLLGEVKTQRAIEIICRIFDHSAFDMGMEVAAILRRLDQSKNFQNFIQHKQEAIRFYLDGYDCVDINDIEFQKKISFFRSSCSIVI
jgi:DNA polymerase III delta prime subunit